MKMGYLKTLALNKVEIGAKTKTNNDKK